MIGISTTSLHSLEDHLEPAICYLVLMSKSLQLFPGNRQCVTDHVYTLYTLTDLSPRSLSVFHLAYLAVWCFLTALLQFYELFRVLLYYSEEDKPDHKLDLYRHMPLSSVNIHYNITDIDNWPYTVAHMSSCNLCFVFYSVINNAYYSNWVLIIKESRVDIFKGKPVIIPRSHSWVVMISSESLIPHVKIKLFFLYAWL